MKSIRKLVATALAGALLVTSLVGCGSNKANETKNSAKADKKVESKEKSGDKEKLTLWLPPFGDDKEVWEPVLKEFEEKNNCEIEFELIPWQNYPEKYATAIAAGEGPDVGYMYAEMFPQFIEMGAVEDLNSHLTEEDYDNYIYIDNGRMMGGLYGLPIVGGNPAVLYYNKDILESIGEKPPVTWEDFIRIAKKATKDTDGDGKIDQWGFAQGWGAKFFGDLNWNWYGFNWQAGGELYNDDLKTVRFNDEAGLEAAQFLYDLKFKHKVIPQDSMAKTNSEMIETTFGPGKAAFCIYLSSKATETFDKEFPDLNYGFITSLKNKAMGTFAAVDQLTLMSAAENKKLAFDLMEHLVSVKSMTRFHKYHPRAPMSKGEPYQGNPKFKEMIENDKGIYRPLVVAPHGVEVYEYLWKQLQNMMSGQSTPKEALDEAARYANDLLAQ